MYPPTLNAVLGLTLVYLTQTTLADTEIRNFRLPLPSRPLSVVLGTPFAQLDAATRQLTLNVSNTRPDLFVQLNMDGDYNDWTIRLSWPGSSPTAFDLQLYPPHPSEAASHNALLQISARPLSIPIPVRSIPLPLLDRLSTLLHPVRGPHSTGKDTEEWTTTFHLVLEPLILGVLPRTAMPALWAILIFGGGAACCVPSIIRLLEGIQQESENALVAAREGKKQ